VGTTEFLFANAAAEPMFQATSKKIMVDNDDDDDDYDVIIVAA
jgi:hypothetical protein